MRRIRPGEAKTAQLKAAQEIGLRLGVAQNEEKYQIKSPLEAANLVMMEMTFLLLNQPHKFPQQASILILTHLTSVRKRI